MKYHRRILLGGLAILIMAVLSACGNDDKSSSQSQSSDQDQSDKKPTITLYNGQHESTIEELVNDFEEKTGIKVKMRSASDSELANQIIEEGEKTPADIVSSEESPPINKLSDENMLASLPDKILDKVPDKYSSQDKDWVGSTARTRVVVYDPDQLSEDELPDTVLDFAKSKWEDKIGYVSTSGSFLEQITTIMKMDDKQTAKDWLKGLKKYAKDYQHNSTALEAVENGEVAAALINNNTWYRKEMEVGKGNMHSDLYRFEDGDPGNIITIPSYGILKSSDNKEAAEKFVNFVLSEHAQQIIAETNGEYPLRSGVSTSEASTGFQKLPFDELGAPPITPADLGTNDKALDLLQEVGLG